MRRDLRYRRSCHPLDRQDRRRCPTAHLRATHESNQRRRRDRRGSSCCSGLRPRSSSRPRPGRRRVRHDRRDAERALFLPIWSNSSTTKAHQAGAVFTPDQLTPLRHCRETSCGGQNDPLPRPLRLEPRCRGQLHAVRQPGTEPSPGVYDSADRVRRASDLPVVTSGRSAFRLQAAFSKNSRRGRLASPNRDLPALSSIEPQAAPTRRAALLRPYHRYRSARLEPGG